MRVFHLMTIFGSGVNLSALQSLNLVARNTTTLKADAHHPEELALS